MAGSSENRPALSVGSVVRDIPAVVHAFLFSPSFAAFAAIGVLFFEMIALKVIIVKVPYTEIDFSTYMQQVKLIQDGQLDYSQVFGDTGNLVYPAGHVQVYQFLYWVSDGGADFGAVQDLFRYLYLATHALTLALYYLAVGEQHLQPWAIFLLALSKRLHSIYVLRLFNDCFTTFAALGTVLILAAAAHWKRTSGFASYLMTIVAADLYSLAISVKMNALLYAPGFLVVVYLLCDENLLKMAVPVAVAVLVQVMTGFKFLMPLDDSPEAQQIRSAYLDAAFNFKRKFLYQWTVNWKFLTEETFLSDEFHRFLLGAQLAVLFLFFATKILTPKVTGKPLTVFVADGFRFWKSTLKPQALINDPAQGPRLVFVTMAVSNLIGVLFSRSLHYQFLSWYAHSLPALLLLNGFPMVVNVALFALNEYSWNVYPSTPVSSAVLIATLAAVVAGVWTNSALFNKEVHHDKKEQ